VRATARREVLSVVEASHSTAAVAAHFEPLVVTPRNHCPQLPWQDAVDIAGLLVVADGEGDAREGSQEQGLFGSI
jgi:hypothetical protein